MTMAWPRFWPIFCATMRAALSTALPAASGTIIRIGLLGQACACAMPVRPASRIMARRRDGFMGSPGSGFLQRRHAELARQRIELRQQRRWQQHSVAFIRDALGVALFAGQPDAFDTGHALAGAQLAHQLVDAGLEGFELAKGIR